MDPWGEGHGFPPSASTQGRGGGTSAVSSTPLPPVRADRADPLDMVNKWRTGGENRRRSIEMKDISILYMVKEGLTCRSGITVPGQIFLRTESRGAIHESIQRSKNLRLRI